MLLGILFGYVMQRSRVCFTGLVRDTYMQGERYNIALFFSIVCIQGLLYYAFASLGMIRIPAYLPPFSLLTIATGSFAFGFGAVMANGCLTATLIKCGDGRLSGWLYLSVFMIVAYIFAAGPAIGLSKKARSVAVVDDALAIRTGSLPLAIFAAAVIVLAAVMIRQSKANRIECGTPPEHKGLRGLLFEKTWIREAGPVAIGAVLGLTYLVSDQFGRYSGFAVSTPVMSWIYTITRPVETCGGCNPYDEHFGWGSMLVLGVILGSFISAKAGGEFKIIRPHRSEVLRGMGGAALMGFGAMWGLGCLLGNGLVGTAQLSLKSWYALIFLVAGIWTATRIFFIPLLRD